MRHPLLAVPFLVACNGPSPIQANPPHELPAAERAQAELGRALFFDAGLSGAGDVSCGSCHAPEHYGAEPLATSVGTGGQELPRNAPSVFNAALKRLQFLDGRADSLETQALGPLFAPNEMGQTEAGLLEYVASTYPERFQAAFEGEETPTVDQVTRALATYQRTLPTPSRVDRYLEGDRDVLTAQEITGLGLFRDNCSFCHSGAGLGGSQLRELGEEVPWPADRRSDTGRMQVTGDPADEMVFVVPSLRNVAQTAPYFHDGSVETLEEAVRLMGRHQLGEDFTDAEMAALVAFLGSLDAESIPPWAFPEE